MDIIQEGTTLIIRGRHLSELDLFVCRVLDILTSYSPYVIVSGYVAILFGRTRSTEDVDLLIPICDESTFLLLHDKFIELGYEFLNEKMVMGCTQSLHPVPESVSLKRMHSYPTLRLSSPGMSPMPIHSKTGSPLSSMTEPSG